VVAVSESAVRLGRTVGRDTTDISWEGDRVALSGLLDDTVIGWPFQWLRYLENLNLQEIGEVGGFLLLTEIFEKMKVWQIYELVVSEEQQLTLAS
jgi:hypothetical protein